MERLTERENDKLIMVKQDNGDYPANTSDAGFVEGWNQCIDEITGES